MSDEIPIGTSAAELLQSGRVGTPYLKALRDEHGMHHTSAADQARNAKSMKQLRAEAARQSEYVARVACSIDSSIAPSDGKQPRRASAEQATATARTGKTIGLGRSTSMPALTQAARKPARNLASHASILAKSNGASLPSIHEPSNATPSITAASISSAIAAATLATSAHAAAVAAAVSHEPSHEPSHNKRRASREPQQQPALALSRRVRVEGPLAQRLPSPSQLDEPPAPAQHARVSMPLGRRLPSPRQATRGSPC